MGVYREQVLPRIQDKVMGQRRMSAVRSRVCSALHGQVVEIGFGTGLNARHYPHAVTQVSAIEPSSVCMRLAAPRIASCPVPIGSAGLDGQHLDLPSGEFDAVLSTWTLCTIPDVELALREVWRVLKTDGTLHFVEHGHSPDQRVAAWQGRIEPLNKRLAGGCHLTRQFVALIERAGFTMEHVDCYYLNGEPKVFGYTYEGRAVKR